IPWGQRTWVVAASPRLATCAPRAGEPRRSQKELPTMLHRHASDRAIAARVGWILGLAGLVLTLRPAAVIAQVGPEESARRAQPAAGLEAALWASEPMLSNPTNIDVDPPGPGW